MMKRALLLVVVAMLAFPLLAGAQANAPVIDSIAYEYNGIKDDGPFLYSFATVTFGSDVEAQEAWAVTDEDHLDKFAHNIEADTGTAPTNMKEAKVENLGDETFMFTYNMLDATSGIELASAQLWVLSGDTIYVLINIGTGSTLDELLLVGRAYFSVEHDGALPQLEDVPSGYIVSEEGSNTEEA